MNSATDLIQNAAKRLASEFEVDAGLERVTLEMSAGEMEGATKIARKLLKQRINALRSAATEIEGLRLQLAQLAETLPFTEQGWLRRKVELANELDTDLCGGLASWLDDWAKAAANGQLAALERLIHDLEMPPAGSALRERLDLATTGMKQLDWNLMHEAIRAGATGLTIGDRQAPDEETRGKLWLLLSRLALRDKRAQEASELLEKASNLAPEATICALRARLAGLREEHEVETQWLESARTADPTNFDVAIESIAAAGASGASAESALEMAQLTIEALPHIAYSERELRPLRGEVPGVIWLAVVERAYREEDFERGDWAVQEGLDSGAAEDIEASISQHYADALRLRQAEKSKRIEALVDAGSRWLWAGQFERALGTLKAALQLDPDHERGSLLFANALTAVAEPMPLEPASEQAEQALATIANTRKHHEVDPTTAWSYLVESSAHMVLARAVSPAARSAEHRWLALTAACRCIVQTGGSASEWQHLAWAANSLELTSVAGQAARHALAIEPSPNDGAKTELAMSLANAGKFAQALEQVPEDNHAWSEALRAFIALREGEPERAVSLLRELDPAPDSPWAIDLLIDSLLLAGKNDEALEEAHAAYARSIDRIDEMDFRLLAVNAMTVLGRLEEGEESLRQLVEENSDFTSLSMLGQLQLLRGQGEAGVTTLVEAFRYARPRNLDDWYSIVEPTLRVLAAQQDVELPPFDAVADAIERRRPELEADEDPVVELEHVQAGAAPAGLVTLSQGMTIALLRLSQGDAQGAAECLDPILASTPEDRELQLLSAWIETVKGAADDEQGERVEQEEVTPEFSLRILLPPSWFKGHEDPLTSHPIFLRYIPEMRLRADWDVPGVQVTIDDAMEPDKYALEVQGSIVDTGNVDLDSLYLPAVAIRDLGLPSGEPAAAEIEARLPGLEAVSRQAAIDSGCLGALLGIPAEELVVRLMGTLADEHAEQLRQS